jgi:hypothetical protein
MLESLHKHPPRFSDNSRTAATRWGALIAMIMVPAGTATAAPSVSPTLVAGFGNTPALAQLAGAALAPNGSSIIAGTAASQNQRRAVAAFNAVNSPPGVAHTFGPTSGAYDLTFASNASGDGALAYSVGHVAYVTTWHGTAAKTERVGASAVKPQPAVAVQPHTGRTLVLWRGRTSRGLNRLQWRVTADGKLGRTRTLGEFGDTPRVATDARGTTVAVWLVHGRAGIRTATRRAGEFGGPTTLTASSASALRLATSDAGSTVAAWLSGPASADPEQPTGTIEVATRTASTAFGAPASVGSGSTLALAGSADGHAVLVTDRHVNATSVVIAASRREPNASFGALTDVAPAQFVSDAYPASGAISDGGRVLVTWAAGVDPSAPTPAGVFASLAEPGASFASPQQLADSQAATLPQPTAGAITEDAAIVAWTGPRGALLARTD